MSLVIIDNYDSFTFNLFQMLQPLIKEPIRVFRNDEISFDELSSLRAEQIVLSPGPGHPANDSDFGVCKDVIRNRSSLNAAILGVCLGHQGIVHHLGGKVVRAPQIVHGKTSTIRITNSTPLFDGIEKEFEAMRYHSLVAESATVPEEITITAVENGQGLVMALQHKTDRLYGVQFHPESIGTPQGPEVAKEFRRKMLSEDTISNLIDCQLPEEKIRQLLIELSSERIDLQILTTFIQTIKSKSEFKFDGTLNAMDCSGTGGSKLAHFNTSTTVAFVLAAGGVKIAKFGNRSASSLSGSFDLLEALGIPASIPYEHVHELLENVGLVFLYAPHYYPSLAKLSAIRKSLPGPSIFNSIGPLLHPLNPRLRLMGTSDTLVQRLIAEYLRADGHTEKAIVVRSERGLDEFDPLSTSHYFEIANDNVTEEIRDERTEDIDVPSEIMTAEFNHEVFHQVLVGSADPYFMHLVCTNAGAGFKVADKVETIDQGIELARELLLTGAVAEKYEQCRRAYAWFVG